ncbi:unnamed protein product, partial [Hapterophycus canaliculatus]
YLAFKIDSDGLLERVFWAYRERRASAVKFGSVVIFDTTFNTNDLSMHLVQCGSPFTTGFALALIVTVDSENKTRIVGQALLRNESTDSFAFVLQHFKKLRHGLSPDVVFTDANKAMTSAIADVYPDALHRYCIWHTLQNII